MVYIWLVNSFYNYFFAYINYKRKQNCIRVGPILRFIGMEISFDFFNDFEAIYQSI